MGTGINKIRKMVDNAGLPPVEFEYNTFFSVIFKRPALKKPVVLDESDDVFEKFEHFAPKEEWFGEKTMPSLVDVKEEDDKIIVTTDVPGVDKKDVEITVKDDVVEMALSQNPVMT